MPKEVKPKEVKPKEVKPKEVKPKEVMPKEVMPKDVKPTVDTAARHCQVSKGESDVQLLNCAKNFVSEIIEDAIREDEDLILYECYVDSDDEELNAGGSQCSGARSTCQESLSSLFSKALAKNANEPSVETNIATTGTMQKEFAEAETMFEEIEDYEAVLSLASDDQEDEDLELEAFTYVNMAFDFARKAVDVGLSFEEAEEEEPSMICTDATEDTEQPVETLQKAASSAATCPTNAGKADAVIAEVFEGASESMESELTLTKAIEGPVQQQEVTAIVPLEPVEGTELAPSEEPEQDHTESAIVAASVAVQQSAVTTDALGETKKKEELPKRSRRKIIGGVVRAPQEVQHLSYDLVAEESTSATTSMGSAQTPPVHTALLTRQLSKCAGSPAGSLRRQLSAHKETFSSYRMDIGDHSCDAGTRPKLAKPGALSRAGSSSSITDAYEALGVEFHSLDAKDYCELTVTMPRAPSAGSLTCSKPLAPPILRGSRSSTQLYELSAMALDLGEASQRMMPPSRSMANKSVPSSTPVKTVQKFQSQVRMDTSYATNHKELDVDKLWGQMSKSSSLGALRNVKSKQSSGLLPALSVKPNTPVDWSMNLTKPARRWPCGTSPVF